MSDDAILTKRLLRPDEVAEILRVSKRTVYYWVATGRLTAPANMGRVVRIHAASVREMIADEGET